MDSRLAIESFRERKNLKVKAQRTIADVCERNSNCFKLQNFPHFTTLRHILRMLSQHDVILCAIYTMCFSPVNLSPQTFTVNHDHLNRPIKRLLPPIGNGYL